MNWKIVPLMLLAAVAFLTVTPACTDGNGNGTSTSSSSGGGGSSGAVACNPEGPVVKAPTAAAAVDSTEAADFGCYTTAPALEAPTNVTAHGCIAIFGVGETVKQGMRLSVYDIDQDPGPGRDLPAYGTVNLVVDSASGCDSEGRYEVTGVPTNTPLIFKAFDTDTGTNKTAVDTYHYNVVLRSDRHSCAAIQARGDTAALCQNNGDYDFEANMIFAATYTSIANVAGRTVEGQNNLSDGIGRAAIAGEVRDCIRDGRSVANATIGGSCVDTPAAKIVYFDGRDDPKPDTTRSATNSDGLFAILNVKATHTVGGAEVAGRQHEVEGRVLVGGEVISAGKQRIYTYPDSVTIFSPQGLPPTTN